MTPKPALPDCQDLDSDEDLEWRDLQAAQMIAMAHVWDNPDDDAWDTLDTSDASGESTDANPAVPHSTGTPLPK